MEFKENNYEKIVEMFKIFGEDEQLYDIFYTNDYPVPYKNLLFYPVQVDLYIIFHLLVECLVLPHKTSGDINAISLSYLDYLHYLGEKKGEQRYIYQLIELLLICLKKERTEIINGQEVPTIDFVLRDKKWYLRIENDIYDSKDFDNIRKIICDQNAVEMPDEETHPDIIKAYKDVEEYKRKQSKVKMGTFEDQINVVVAKSPYKRSDAIKMTIRSFTRLLERIDKVLHYEIYTLLSPNMDKKGKDGIEYYLSAEKTREERYKSAFIDVDEVKDKLK